MIKYIGSKRILVPWILKVASLIRRLDASYRVADLFSGSSRVAHALKGMGFWVLANDINTYAFVLAKALVEADARTYSREKVEPLLKTLMSLPPQRGWFTERFCLEARYFQPKNGARIEAIREYIESMGFRNLGASMVSASL
ncbi:MAG: DNA adenine methylase [Thermus sp.]|uniref:DNA adenine methylase n=1 Tax=Thermus sp. TaxID=275 RepID=UPI00391A5DE6